MIPDKPLALALPAAEELTLDDLQLFEADGFTVRGFKAFISRYSNWTAADVGKLSLKEVKEVTLQLKDALNDSAVPKATSASS
jgi:hypothetical protein